MFIGREKELSLLGEAHNAPQSDLIPIHEMPPQAAGFFSKRRLEKGQKMSPV
jgi:hypothetical protein